jgi:predicted CopG family antitoxin
MARTKNKKNKQPILENFMQQVAAKNEGAKYLLNPKGEISMSDVIAQLIEPYKEDAPDYQSFRTLVTFACTAWNASILPPEERDEMLDKMLEALPSQKKKRSEIVGFIAELMNRKKQLFPHITRMIVEFKVTDLGQEFHIAIASTLGKQE